MNVAVVALGKIGLPLAVRFAAKGHSVIGADTSASVVEAVNAGRSPVQAEADLDRLLADVVERGLLTATADVVSATRSAEAVVIVVPLVVDDQGRPDFRPLDTATHAVASGLRPGTLVSYETTMPVGTTRGRLAPALAASSGLVLGRDLFVCHSPERVSSGRVFRDLRRYPKLVGAIDENSAARAVAFYEAVLDFDDRRDLARDNGVWDLGSAEAAELAKLAETTYRDVNIALVNEFATFADRIGVDIEAVIEACNSQPFSHLHQPGIAVGGHCIPVYPRFYLEGHPDAVLPAAARTVNHGMPEYAVAQLEAVVGDLRDQTVAVLGVAYRGGVKEVAFSGVFDVVHALRRRGANAVVHDPLFSTDELTALGLEPYSLRSPCDAVVVQAEHREYRQLGPEDVPGAKAVLDGRRVLDRARFDGAGVRIVAIGEGADRGSPRST